MCRSPSEILSCSESSLWSYNKSIHSLVYKRSSLCFTPNPPNVWDVNTHCPHMSSSRSYKRFKFFFKELDGFVCSKAQSLEGWWTHGLWLSPCGPWNALHEAVHRARSAALSAWCCASQSLLWPSHAWVSYVPSALVFLFNNVLIFGLLCWTLLREINCTSPSHH